MVHKNGSDQRVKRSASFAALLAASLFACAGLGGCGDEPVRQEAKRVDPAGAAPHKTAWLELSSPLSPAQWLASRGEEDARPITDPEVQRVAELLATAHTRYRESERMIANRSAQLSEMLEPHGIKERATDILGDLTSIGGKMGQTEGFGAVSQYYFNLRVSSVTRTEALATLKTRYGATP